jgi:hypothetical protein
MDPTRAVPPDRSTRFYSAMPDVRAARDAEALARAWSEQFTYRDARRRDREVASLTPLARNFLGWVDEADDAA